METKRKKKDLSTLQPWECITEHIIWGFIFFLYYKNLFFIPLDNQYSEKSKIILLILIIVASIVGSIIRWRKNMTRKGVIADLLIALGIYTICAYASYYKVWFGIVGTIAVIGIALFTVCTLITRVKGRSLFKIAKAEVRNAILKKRMMNLYNTSALYLGLIFVIMLVPIAYNRFFNGGIIKADYISLKEVDYNNIGNELGLMANLDIIEKIRENSRWKPLSTQQKLNCLQAICDCERNYFGLDYNIYVVMDDLPEGTLGSYDDSEKIIKIDKQHLEENDSWKVLRTLLHEMYHSYEYSLVSLYLDSSESQRKLMVFRHCREYIEEMKDYQKSGEDFESFMHYYHQYMERDSRQYSEENVYQYFLQIDLLQGADYNGEILD